MELIETIRLINYGIAVLFFLCYFYQFVYIPVPFLKRDKPHKAETLHRYAVLICARNEESVIGYLIDSIRAQDYPAELVTVFVLADNCTDATARVAADHGAVVYERFNKKLVGKGYAMECLMEKLKAEYDPFDGYFVFDADNLLEPDYITQMNRTFSDGYEIITSYRNSKNYGDNWISAGYGLWFLREAAFLNHPRCLLGTSCAVSGTGFLFSHAVLEDCGGWPFHLLTEDIEFTIHNITRGRKIGYCGAAVYYDEQPTKFLQSWHQRMRWARGYLQVFGKYGTQLLRGIFRPGGFACFDMCMNIMPAIILTSISLVVNIAVLALTFWSGAGFLGAVLSLLQTVVNTYLLFLMVGGITTIAQWGQIHTSGVKKILYIFTFPFFMFTYIPISFVALFKKVEWKHIDHTVSVSVKDLQKQGGVKDTTRVS